MWASTGRALTVALTPAVSIAFGISLFNALHTASAAYEAGYAVLAPKTPTPSIFSLKSQSEVNIRTGLIFSCGPGFDVNALGGEPMMNEQPEDASNKATAKILRDRIILLFCNFLKFRNFI
ncbi:hypothetical protein D3C86_1675770 [compost metagenome]